MKSADPSCQPNVRPNPAFVDPREHVSVEAGLRIDAMCGQFERCWREAKTPALESFLTSLSLPDRPALLREMLAIELEYRSRGREQFASDEYLRRFPDDQALIAMLFDELHQRGAHALAGSPEQKLHGNSTAIPSEVDRPSFLADHPRYRLVRFLGAGGMGSVYLAEHRLMQRMVALKVIRPDLLADRSTRERFHHEIKVAAQLIHPNIVSAFDAEQLGEHSLLAMEYVEGSDLASVVRDQGSFPAAEACGFIRQAALGLQHAYDLGMVHRDIKPHNLILSTSRQVKILDFGLAHFISDLAATTQTDMLVGTVDYIAPEQATDSRTAGTQADIYSLGCTLYYLLTGRPPFSSGSLLQRLKCHADLAPPRIDGLPEGLWTVLSRMLAKKPAERFQEPCELVLALEPFIEDTSTASIKKSTAVTRSADRASVRQRLIGAGVFLLLAACAPALFLNADRSTDVPQRAQELYDEAQLQLGQRQEEVTKDATSRLKQALALAPNYLDAHVALANAYNLQGDYGWARPDTVYPLAKASALRALEIDQHSAGAHLALAFTLHEYDCNLQQAESEYKTAIQQEYDSTNAHHWYAWLLAQNGRFADAILEIDCAARLGTSEIIATNAGKIRYYSGFYEEAVQKLQNAIALNPQFLHAQFDLALVYAEIDGKRDQAIKQLQLLKNTSEDQIEVLAALAYCQARAGNSAEARKLLAVLEQPAFGEQWAYEIATVYSELAAPDQAFHWLQVAFDQKSAWRTYVKIDPRLNRIRSDSRFKKYIRDAGLMMPPQAVFSRMTIFLAVFGQVCRDPFRGSPTTKICDQSSSKLIGQHPVLVTASHGGLFAAAPRTAGLETAGAARPQYLGKAAGVASHRRDSTPTADAGNRLA